jgi:hypothetical protein
MNLDGGVTITDVGLWLEHLFYLPGDLVLSLSMEHARPLADFLEIDSTLYGSLVSGVLSSILWLTATFSLAYLFGVVANADRAVTGYGARLYRDLQRQARVLRIRATTLIGALRRRRRNVDNGTDGLQMQFIELDHLELALLRSHANIQEFEILTAREVAGSVGESLRNVQEALESLHHLGLIESSLGTCEGEQGHRLTSMGRAYLSRHPARRTPAQAR